MSKYASTAFYQRRPSCFVLCPFDLGSEKTLLSIAYDAVCVVGFCEGQQVKIEKFVLIFTWDKALVTSSRHVKLDIYIVFFETDSEF